MFEKGKGYVAVFSSLGKLVAYSTDQGLLKKTAVAMLEVLPTFPRGDSAAGIQRARREALIRISEGK